MRTVYGITVSISLLLCFYGPLAAGQKILYIDSYHAGYGWSDGITSGVKEALDGKGIDLKIIRMDTKRNRSEEFKKQAALKAKAVIDEFKPDVVIASDDNASKYLIMPYYRNARLPFVFCGVNWDAAVYGFPYKNVTGMIEVAPVPQLLEYLKQYARGNRVGFLAPDLLSAKKETDNYKDVFGIDLVEYYAEDVADWKAGFMELQEEVDMLMIDSDGDLYEEHADDLRVFVEKNTKIPSGTCLDFMAPYVLIAFAKLAEEQGVWAAETALKILGGTDPSAIPIAKNKEGYLIINVKIAEAIGIDIPYSVLKSAKKIIE